MKKLILTLMLLAPLGLVAQQSNFDKFMKKYDGKDGYTCTNFEGDALKMMMSALSSSGTDSNKNSESLKNITSFKMIMTKNASEEFIKNLDKVIKADNFKSVASVKEEKTNVKVYMVENGDSKDKKDEPKKMLLIVGDDKDCIVMNLTGKGDMSEIVNYIK